MIFKEDDFKFFTEFLRKRSGYNLSQEKHYLLEARIGEVIKKNNVTHVGAIIEAINKDANSQIAVDVLEAMTVNETFFFRDKIPFETYSQKILPRLQDWPSYKRFRIWSAACSTGQEPYSMAMIMENYAEKFPNVSYEIIATDINHKVLDKARTGIYTEMEVSRGLNDEYRNKFFVKKGNDWHLSERIKNKVTFRQLNLLDDIGLQGVFDFVLLRNVLIYFDKDIKDNIFSKVASKITADGYLLLGAAEGIYDNDHLFQRCPNIDGLYKLREAQQSDLRANNAV